jgi:hypothetical protein
MNYITFVKAVALGAAAVSSCVLFVAAFWAIWSRSPSSFGESQ